MGAVDIIIKDLLEQYSAELASKIESDVILYIGQINIHTPKCFHHAIEYLKSEKHNKGYNTLSIILETPGGVVEYVEKSVEIIRNRYNVVNFIVTDYAMSAGTVFCMAGDNIYMSPQSSLGPIDPQVVRQDGTMVPALGYLEQLEKFIKKSLNGEISPAEIDMLRRLDLGDINLYEQARNLTITLIKKWLQVYKFKDWDVHQSTKNLFGKKVTPRQKEARAEDVAKKLGDIKLWHSHGRHIGLNTLRDVLKLKIEDYTYDPDLNEKIMNYYDIAKDYYYKNRFKLFVHAINTIYEIR